MDYKDWFGQNALDENRDKVGTIDQLYVDGDTNEPTWATIKSGLFGTKTHFVPLALAKPAENGIRFQTTAQVIQEAPGIDTDDELSAHDQAKLYRHYSQHTAADTADESEDTAEDDDDETSEDAGSTVAGETRSGDRVRLRKYVITEIITDSK